MTGLAGNGERLTLAGITWISEPGNVLPGSLVRCPPDIAEPGSRFPCLLTRGASASRPAVMMRRSPGP